MALVINGVDVAYKLNPSLPSDTRTYYVDYFNLNADISQNVFPFYIYFLRIIEYPFHSALFAVWGQAVITFFLLDIIVRNKRNLLFLCFFHAIIYTNANMFKDNLILIFSLLTYIFLSRCHSKILQSIIIFFSIVIISRVRPFLYLTTPACLIPFYTHLRSQRLRKILLVAICLTLIIVFVLAQGYIQGVANAFSDDASVLAGKASPPVAFVKILIGPTPIHYLHSEKFMVQPFGMEQSVLYCVYNLLYYIVFVYWIIYLIRNYKEVFYDLNINTPKLYIFSLAFAQTVVYVVIYGSADIRQRALIITFLFLATINKTNIFKIPDTFNNRLAYFSLVCLMGLITVMSS